LELLKALSFLSKSNSVENLEIISDSELQSRLDYYHRSRIESVPQEAKALKIDGLRNSILLSSISARNTISGLSPKFLACDTIVANDRLFYFAAPQSEVKKTQWLLAGSPKKDGIDRKKLTKILHYYAGMASFMEAGFLHVLPYTMPEPPADSIPITYSKDRYRSLVPDRVYEFVRESVQILSLERHHDVGLVVVDKPEIQRTRTIGIRFRDDDVTSGMGIHRYSTMQPEGRNPDGSYRVVFDVFNETPLDEATYKSWVEQCFNKDVGMRLQNIGEELILANTLGVPYLTESQFETELLSKAGVSSSGEATDPISFLEANLGSLAVDDPQIVFRLRTDAALLLTRFRDSLENIADKLQGVSPSEFTAKSQQLFRTEIESQIEEIRTTQDKLFMGAVAGAVTFGFALLTGNVLPVSAVIPVLLAGAGVGALPTVPDYLKGKRRPEFIWQKLVRK
jgi:hypothetical protein